MNNLCLLLVTLFLTTSCCQKQGVSVNLSLYTTSYGRCHYVMAEITNHTSNDIYVPHLRNFISIYKNGANITHFTEKRWGYDYDRYGYSQCEIDDSLIFNAPDTLELRVRDMTYIFSESQAQEIETFRKINLIDSVNTPQLEQQILEIIDNQYLFDKYDGIILKAGETKLLFQPIHMLFFNGKPRGEFEIKFERHNFFESALYDTIKTFSGYKLFCGLPDSIGNYKLYTENPQCKDNIAIRMTQ